MWFLTMVFLSFTLTNKLQRHFSDIFYYGAAHAALSMVEAKDARMREAGLLTGESGERVLPRCRHDATRVM
jgi:hypothetical protein